MKSKNIFGFLKKINWNAIPIAINEATKYGKQHLPTILTVVGIGGFWAAGAVAAEQYHKAKEEIKKEAERRESAEEEKLERIDELKIVAEYCWPAGAIAGTSTILILRANNINLTRIAGMTALYQGAKNELTAIQNRIDNGENEELKRGDLIKARQQLHCEEYEKNPVKESDRIYSTRNGDTLFVEVWSGARFYSSTMAVNSAITELNTRLQEDNYVGLDEFYDMLDLDSRTRKCGRFAAFRLNTMKDVIHPNQILDWRDYTDPNTGEPRICFIDFTRFLTPSDEFAEHGIW